MYNNLLQRKCKYDLGGECWTKTQERVQFQRRDKCLHGQLIFLPGLDVVVP